MKKLAIYIIILTISIACYIKLFEKVEYQRDSASYESRLFYLPPYELLEITSVGFKEIMAEFLLFKTIVYYGEMLMNEDKEIVWDWIVKSFDASSKLDPYNIDIYYIAQAVLSWDGDRYNESTKILERGMKYRDWDWYLPFFVGFNYFYFFKDKVKAAEIYKVGAKLNPELITLVAKMYEQTNRTKVAIAYLKGVLFETSNPVIKKNITIKLKALENSEILKEAYQIFFNKFERPLKSMEEFVTEGILPKIPVDPYGKVYSVNEKGELLLLMPKEDLEKIK